MRNLKRALSLTLASVMLLGMMVVGSSAAAGYDDVKETDNVEAIEVLQAVEVMVGDERGFGPDRPVSRAEMAVVMGKLLNLDYNYYVSTCPFTDVSGNYDWARGWVGACAANGIVSGRGNGIYDPAATVTAVEAASMMMRALGYFQHTEDYAAGFQLATVKQGSEIGIFNGVGSDGNTAMTRNQVAQMALNALRSNMVTFTGTPGIEVNGVKVGYRAEYSPRTGTESKYDAIANLTTTILTDNGQYFVQLGEQLYDGKLKLKDNTTDVFGRPARYWEYDGDEIGTYVRDELLREEYTVEVTGKTLYDLLGSATLKEYDLNVTIDGESDPEVFDGFNPQYTDTNRNEYWPLFNATYLNRNNDHNVGDTGNGVLTQVFVDTAKKTVYISVINTYLAEANDDYDEKNELVDLQVYGIDEWKKDIFAKAIGSDEQITVTAEEFDIADVADGDFFLVTVADGAIQSMKAPEVLPGVEISSFTKDRDVTVDGTKYNAADTLDFDRKTLKAWTDGDIVNLKDRTYNVYLDQYGYAVGVEEVDAVNNYVFITGVNGNFNNLANVNVEANAIFLDGTMDTITINSRKSTWKTASEELNLGVDDGATVNRWFTYTKSSNDVYNVKLVEYGVNGKLGQFHEDRDGVTGTDVVDYKKHNVMVYDNKDLYAGIPVTDHVVYSNDKTVFLTASLDQIETSTDKFSVVIDDVDSVAVGIDNVDITPWGHDEVLNRTAYDKAEADHSNLCNDLPAGDNCNMSYGVYALYDEDSYILGMVVVGEDNGLADNLVYVDSGSVKDESYNKTTEEWTWTREAIVNGERVLLTEVNDTGISLLKAMDKHHWYRVNYNTDGEVTKVRSHNHVAPVPTWCYDNDTDFADWSFGGSYAYVHQYSNPTNAIYEAITTPGVDVVLYHEQFFKVKPSNSGHTLYMVDAKEEASGIRYTEDTNIVFIQTERNKEYTEFWKGEAGVKKALKAMHPVNKDDERISYAISAVWKDGRATAIIFRDLNAQGTDGYWDVTKTGPVVFENSKGVVDYAKEYEIKNAWTRANDLGVGHVYFELDTYPTTGLINDGDGKIPFTYSVYVNGTSLNDRVLIDRNGTMTRKINTTNIYQFDADVGTFFNASDKIYVEITDWDIVGVPVTGVTVTPDKATLKVGETVELEATVTPAGAAKVTWTSDNTAVATVDENGKVTAVAAGNATITATAGGKSATCAVTVKSAESGDEKFVGSAKVDVDFDAARDGDTLTITAKRKIVVYDENGDHHTVMKGETRDVTVPEGTEVRVNKVIWLSGENNSLKETEVDENGDPVVHTPKSKLARAARAEEAAKYQKMILTDSEGKDHEFIVKVVTDAEGLDTIYFPNKESVDQAVEILNDVGEFAPDFSEATDEEIEEAWGETTVPGDDATIWADVKWASAGTNHTATFTEYLGDAKDDPDALNEEEVAAALNAAAKKANLTLTFTADKVDLTTGSEKATSLNGHVVTFTNEGTPERVWKITYPGGYVYAEKNVPTTVEDITGGATMLMDASKPVGAAETVTVDPKTGLGTATTLKVDNTTPKDIEYKAAVKLMATGNTVITDGKITDGVGGGKVNLHAEVYDGKQWVSLAFTNSTGTHILVGTTIRFTQPSATERPDAFTAGDTVVLQVNGQDSDVKFTVGADKNFTSSTPQTITVPAQTKKVDTLDLKAVVKSLTSDVKVFVGTEEIDVQGAEGSEYVQVPNMKENGAILHLVGQVKNASGELEYEEVTITPATDLDTQGVATVALSTVDGVGIKPDENGVIHLWRAYKVESQTDLFTIYEEYSFEEDATNEAIDSSNGLFVIQGSGKELYLEADYGIILAEKNAASPLEGMCAESRVTFADGGDKAKGVWKVTVSGNIDANTYEAWAKFLVTANVKMEFAKAAVAAKDKVTVAVPNTAIKLSAKADLEDRITVVGFDGKDFLAGYDASNFSVAKTTGTDKDTLTVTFTNGTTAIAENSGAAVSDAGTLLINVEGVLVSVAMTRAGT